MQPIGNSLKRSLDDSVSEQSTKQPRTGDENRVSGVVNGINAVQSQSSMQQNAVVELPSPQNVDAMDIDASPLQVQAIKTDEVSKPHFFECTQKILEEEKILQQRQRVARQKLEEEHQSARRKLEQEQSTQTQALQENYLEEQCKAFFDLLQHYPQDLSNALIMLLENNSLFLVFSRVPWELLPNDKISNFWKTLFAVIQMMKKNNCEEGAHIFFFVIS